jgi:hypothetical protein
MPQNAPSCACLPAPVPTVGGVGRGVDKCIGFKNLIRRPAKMGLSGNRIFAEKESLGYP